MEYTTDKNMMFSASEWLRYTRHVQLPNVGAEGQVRLKSAKVLIVGAGGLGSPVALYLAAAGVGTITIIDGDSVDVTNLQRQILFGTQHIGESKAESAKQRLNDLNPEIAVNVITEPLSENNAPQWIASVDLVLDCTDNFSTRYLINDVCLREGKPWVFSAIHQFSGQCALFLPEDACFRCLFPESPSVLEDCNTAGVLGVLPGILGTLQANEALKYLIGLSVPLKGSLLLVDALELNFTKIAFAKDSQCLSCGSVDLSSLTRPSLEVNCSIETNEVDGLTVEQFEGLRKQEDYCVLDVRTKAERAAFNIGGRHIALDQLQASLDEVGRDKTVLCYCQSGVRSRRASALLESNGIRSKSLNGGLAGWLKHISL